MRTTILKQYKCLITGCLFAFSINLNAQQPTPAKMQTKSILLSNVTVHTGNGKVIENALVGFKNGKIDLVADATLTRLSAGAYDTTISLVGKHLYPGFIAPNSTLGLNEIDAVRATNDFDEVGAYNPNVRALISYNTDSKVTPTVRTNGVLFAQVTPKGGVISGTSSVMALDGWNWEDAVVKTDDGIHLNFPRLMNRRNGKPNPDFEDQLNELKKYFADAKAYSLTKDITEKNLAFEAMRGLFEGKKTLFIHVDFVKDIVASINFAKEYTSTKIVLVGAKESYKTTSFLRENKIAVMINRVHDLPGYEHDDIDLPYKLAYLLQKDSVEFCLQNEGDMEGMNTRNLPFLAGTTVAYGLTKEQALASITSSTAKILGLNNLGTVEVGKDASFIVSEGDALDIRTNNIILAYINGKSLQLTNEQQELYNRYKIKFGIK